MRRCPSESDATRELPSSTPGTVPVAALRGSVGCRSRRSPPPTATAVVLGSSPKSAGRALFACWATSVSGGGPQAGFTDAPTAAMLAQRMMGCTDWTGSDGIDAASAELLGPSACGRAPCRFVEDVSPFWCISSRMALAVCRASDAGKLIPSSRCATAASPASLPVGPASSACPRATCRLFRGSGGAQDGSMPSPLAPACRRASTEMRFVFVAVFASALADDLATAWEMSATWQERRQRWPDPGWACVGQASEARPTNASVCRARPAARPHRFCGCGCTPGPLRQPETRGWPPLPLRTAWLRAPRRCPAFRGASRQR